MVKMVFGSGRFRSAVTNNQNIILVGGFDIPTKLVDAARDVGLCLPANLEKWGMYPTHQESWLTLFFIVACHSRHEDEAGLEVRRQAWERIPAGQWLGVAAKAVEFIQEFRQRLERGDLNTRKVFKSLTRALQDCLLYLLERRFPADQDRVLADSSIRELVERANAGRAGKLTVEQGPKLAEEVENLVSEVVAEFGGIEKCRAALTELQKDNRPGRVILLPAELSLEQASALVEYDVVIGIPDEHDLDCISVVDFVKEPRLFQLKDVLSGQRMDIIAVPPDLTADMELKGGHPPFQTVAEMMMANGRAVSETGKGLVTRLRKEIDPVALAGKYLKVAWRFLVDREFPKSWAARKNRTGLPQVKKIIPLYRVACDLLPRAGYMLKHGHSGGLDPEELVAETGLEAEYRKIHSFLEEQDAPQEELEKIAETLMARLKKERR